MAHMVSRSSGHIILINPEDKFLAVQAAEEDMTPNGIQKLWLTPGGRLEEAETNPVEALRREIKEETGITQVTHIFPIHISIWDSPYCSSRLSTIYIGLTDGNEPISLQADELSSYRWAGFDEVKNIEFCEDNIPIAIKKAQRLLPLLRANPEAFGE